MPYKNAQIRHAFDSWRNMIRRCEDPSHTNYKHYGAAGITVCRQWKTFRAFLKDMGPRPDGHVLDRKDNLRGYCKSNCRWVTHKESTENRRITVWIGNERVEAVAVRLGIPTARIYSRVRRGWTIEELEKHPGAVRSGWTKTGPISPYKNAQRCLREAKA